MKRMMGHLMNMLSLILKIISQSEELIYVGEGEGCLSVNRPVEVLFQDMQSNS